MSSHDRRPTQEDFLVEAREKFRQITSYPDVKEGMVYIPGGEFAVDLVERINVAAFWIDRTPVTNAEYARFLRTHPDHPPPTHRQRDALNWKKVSRWGNEYTYPEGQANHPVVLVSLHDADKYAKWMNKRLPTWQEWMKAGRGILGKPYPWGWSNPTPILCNMNRKGTTPVGLFSPQGDSLYGCADMAGNVEEWIGDDFGVVLGRMEKKLLGGYNSSGEWSDEYGPRRLDIVSGTDSQTKWISIGFRCASDA